jgi:uncharacterized protein (TIGR00297 family)
MTVTDGIVAGILLAGLLFSIGRKKLTIPAALTGAAVGWVIYSGGGLTGVAMLIVFFTLGTAATSWKKDRKIDVRSHAAHQSTRTTGQVLANAGVAGLCGVLNLLIGGHGRLFALGMAGCFAAAAADTLSSELGMVYGRRFFNIMTGRRDIRGLDGVVSMEGLAIGTVAAAVIAGVFAIGTGWNGRVFLIIVAAGTVGNWVDSVLGAVFERKGLLSNDTVNFINTLAGAVFAGWASCGL